MAVVTRFTVDRKGMDTVLKSRNGPVVLSMANLGRKIAGNARRLAPRSSTSKGPHLADNIDSKLVPLSGGGYGVNITANVPHALFVSKGTKPHSIGSPVLVAPGEWRYIGLSPSGRGKIHPGTKQNRYMLRAAEMEGLKTRRLV